MPFAICSGGRRKCYLQCQIMEYLRSIVNCIFLKKEMQKCSNAVMQFIIDTGAAITCCRAKELGINLKEEEFIASRAAVKYLNGVLKETGNEYGKDIYSIKFYEVKMKKLKLGTSIILTNVSVWVTFDNRFYTCLMGQDILDKLYYMHWSNTRKLFIAENAFDLKEYINCMLNQRI